jgi:hypothetical protein
MEADTSTWLALHLLGYRGKADTICTFVKFLSTHHKLENVTSFKNTYNKRKSLLRVSETGSSEPVPSTASSIETLATMKMLRHCQRVSMNDDNENGKYLSNWFSYDAVNRNKVSIH